MNDKNEETVGQRIRRRRKELKKTMMDIAGEMGVSTAAVSLWERDEASISGQRINQLCKALGCSSTWLLDGIERLTPNRVENPHTQYEMEKLDNIFNILPKEYRLKIVEYAQNLLDDYYAEVSAKIDKIKSMKMKE
ncbi:helix-turn-helix domain-containing protein [Xenorhabdus szentirmaii]|uniref:Helix-turn-helix domain-containing protein n=1 Tax=Xenorhabdus szentirmaii TaxID=290112 RepID=A0AAW3YMG1_9GAMM|nr:MULTISPECIES: helix-turn-helix domain-containing protein [unclassified Xenorhabdus]MBD2782776.1 helix-turn-helix domain-containing protein [Xenorhabdus sp. 38]MBD2799223.1 helix-turn-helix domain-containing protein [Xenorhabdus sp. M]